MPLPIRGGWTKRTVLQQKYTTALFFQLHTALAGPVVLQRIVSNLSNNTIIGVTSINGFFSTLGAAQYQAGFCPRTKPLAR
jgi:hypothetical protein